MILQEARIDHQRESRDPDISHLQLKNSLKNIAQSES